MQLSNLMWVRKYMQVTCRTYHCVNETLTRLDTGTVHVVVSQSSQSGLSQRTVRRHPVVNWSCSVIENFSGRGYGDSGDNDGIFG